MKKIPDEVMEKFLDLVCELSPENLCCDGELSPAAVDRKERRLIREWEALEREYQVKMTEKMVWDWDFKRITNQ